MDGLIVLLMIIGLVARINKKKKKDEQNRRRQAGFNDAAALPAEGKKPSAAEKIADAFELVDEAAGQVKIPYTKEEWNRFLKETAVSEKKASANPAPKAKAAPKKREPASDHVFKAILRSGDSSLIANLETGHSNLEKNAAAEGQAFQKITAQRLTAERLRPADQHLEGESRKEHGAHKQRIAEEEARLHREREELRELRNVNLKKLRSAVVMSEVLGKPVALRGRR